MTRSETDLYGVLGGRIEMLIKSQERDPELRNIKEKVRKSPQGEHLQDGQRFHIESGVLIATERKTGNRRYCAPKQLLPDILASHHTLHHWGKKKTLESFRGKWYTRKPVKETENYLRSCYTCQKWDPTVRRGSQKSPHHLSLIHI